MTKFDWIDLELEVFDALPCHAFIKDIEGKYIYCNNLMAQDLGLSTPSEIIGLKDKHLVWYDYASRLMKNDTHVLKKQEKLVFIEPVITSKNRVINLYSHKSPLMDRNNSLVGVLGFSYTKIKSNLISNIPNLVDVDYKNHFISTLFSKRQIECLR